MRIHTEVIQHTYDRTKQRDEAILNVSEFRLEIGLCGCPVKEGLHSLPRCGLHVENVSQTQCRLIGVDLPKSVATFSNIPAETFERKSNHGKSWRRMNPRSRIGMCSPPQLMSAPTHTHSPTDSLSQFRSILALSSGPLNESLCGVSNLQQVSGMLKLQAFQNKTTNILSLLSK